MLTMVPHSGDPSLLSGRRGELPKNYIILFKSPLVLNKYKLIVGCPFNNALDYKENLSSFFVIIDRRNSKVIEVETDNFVCLHSINAYEASNELILDLICHALGNPYDKLYLTNILSPNPSLPLGEIRRYTINLKTKIVNKVIVSSYNHEFPRINYNLCNGSNYQYAYSVYISNPKAKFFNAIHKLNTKTGVQQTWEKNNYYLGEAVFIPKPDSKLEDAGVLLSIGFDMITKLSSMLIIDALSMQQLAEIYLPIHLPFGLHGEFYQI